MTTHFYSCVYQYKKNDKLSQISHNGSASVFSRATEDSIITFSIMTRVDSAVEIPLTRTKRDNEEETQDFFF